jgi:hypothetical protein
MELTIKEIVVLDITVIMPLRIINAMDKKITSWSHECRFKR